MQRALSGFQMTFAGSQMAVIRLPDGITIRLSEDPRSTYQAIRWTYEAVTVPYQSVRVPYQALRVALEPPRVL